MRKQRKHKVLPVGCGRGRSSAGMFRTPPGRTEIPVFVDLDQEKTGSIADLLPAQLPVISNHRGGLPLCGSALQAPPRHLHGSATGVCLMISGEKKKTPEGGAPFLFGLRRKQFRPPENGPEEILRGLRVIWALYDAEEKGTLADLRGI